jgi:hypothetical protein
MPSAVGVDRVLADPVSGPTVDPDAGAAVGQDGVADGVIPRRNVSGDGFAIHSQMRVGQSLAPADIDADIIAFHQVEQIALSDFNAQAVAGQNIPRRGSCASNGLVRDLVLDQYPIVDTADGLRSRDIGSDQVALEQIIERQRWRRTAIEIAGVNTGDFSQTNTCGSALNAGANCTITVTFSPASAVSFSATLSVADNAAGSPQTVALTETRTQPPSFTLSSSMPSQSVQPGSAASYAITVTPQNGAFSSAVTFSASGMPAGATASFSPATVTPGSAAVATQLSIQTAAATVEIHRAPLWSTAGPILALIGILVVPGRRRRQWLALRSPSCSLSPSQRSR